MTAIRAKVSETGRISLPAQHRRLIGLEHGGEVVVRVEDGEIRIRTIAETVARVQEKARRLLADRPASVDDFLTERRRDAERE